ncbi:MAG: nicotinamide riboside transporter PnuC [Methylophilaceae bacterium]|jgi:nicotinamide mononucleotide transporter|nr:MAG: nicotinamide riboside transporter PnuC [Methylophilaceae bacterium]
MENITLSSFMTAFSQLSGWEVTAALMGVAYILLAAKESQWCWLFAFISTVIYTVLFWEGQLPMQALLNFYYIGMAIYGFCLWQQHGKADENLMITSWPYSKHLLFVMIGVAISALATYYLALTQQSQSPMLDAYTTVFAVMNTWLMARKILQNWLYWVVIDAAAVVLYIQTNYYATAVLFVINTILAIAGYLNWLKLHQKQSATF